MMNKVKCTNPIWIYLFTLAVCLGVGALGGYATAGGVTTWYPTINKATFNPPDWIFAPVWTLLYVLMSIAWAMVLTNREATNAAIKRANRLFILQLGLNLMWSFIFFNWHLIGLAFLDILLILITLSFTIVHFYKISKVAGCILIPYWLWVSFAGILNGVIWYLN
jgi:benzodiazapine receptor